MVVVSEQSGTISVAQNCKLKRGYDQQELERELLRLMMNYSAGLRTWDEEFRLSKAKSAVLNKPAPVKRVETEEQVPIGKAGSGQNRNENAGTRKP